MSEKLCSSAHIINDLNVIVLNCTPLIKSDYLISKSFMGIRRGKAKTDNNTLVNEEFRKLKKILA